MSFISPSYLHALQVASETELVVAVQVENAAHVLLAELAGCRFNEVKSVADLDSLCDSWLWLLLLLVLVVLVRSEYLKAWVQKRVLGPCESQKWHSAIMAFILCRLMVFVTQEKKNSYTKNLSFFFVTYDV
jgi:hypothetical protein